MGPEAKEGPMLQVSRSVTIRRPRQEVYRFWRDLENLPRFMRHVEDVSAIDEKRSRWVVTAPGNRKVEWEAEIVDETPNERIAWRSLPGADVQHAGSVQFREAPGDRGTEVRVQLQYDAPAGKAGALVAKLLGEEPRQQVRDDLRRFKQVMEVGEIVLSEGSLEGAGEGAAKERPAQPPEVGARR
jgi:uncharacterized membrane protein